MTYLKPLSERKAKETALSITLIVFAIFFIYPLFFVVVNSFRPNADIIINPTGLPLKLFMGNYVQAWKEMQFPRVFLNTLLVTVFGTGGIILFSAMCAYGLVRNNFKISGILYALFAFALVIPFQIIMVTLGVLASDLHLMHVPGLIPMYWGLGCPTAIFMFHGFIKSVPKELEESAAIDGAGKFYIFFRIVFPLIKTIISTIAVIDALWIWNDFLLPLIVAKQGTIQLAQMRFNGQFMKDYGPMCASLTISSIPIIAFYLGLQKYIIKGIAAGAVKG
ncbi:MAG: carbohydrate ABC transporter permease [Treponema sp.]|nr:carbohydrate ABC transporter permease [Treponema sp.]